MTINEKDKQFIEEINKLNVREEVEKYKAIYKIEELHSKLIANLNSDLNQNIIKAEELWYTIYNDKEEELLREAFMALDILLDIKFYIRDYILSFEDEKLF